MQQAISYLSTVIEYQPPRITTARCKHATNEKLAKNTHAFTESAPLWYLPFGSRPPLTYFILPSGFCE